MPMPNVAHKKTPPQEDAWQLEHQMLRQRREANSAFDIGAMDHVAVTSTGEEVKIDPLRRMSVYKIFEAIRRNFAKKDEAHRQQALETMQADLGVAVDTELPEATVDHSAEPDAANNATAEDAAEAALNRAMHKLAEDIYDALERAHQSIAVIQPESIGSKITSRLDEPGDANFLVASGEGEKLYNSLREQNSGLHVLKRNTYGFVMENAELGYTALFIFQDRITSSGELIQPESEPAAEPITNVAGVTSRANERPAVPEADANPNHVYHLPNRAQSKANQSRRGQPSSFAAASKAKPPDQLAA